MFLDYDKDGYLDIYSVRYVSWGFDNNPYCGTKELRGYCHPREFEGVPDLLYRNKGDGTFEDVSERRALERELSELGDEISHTDNSEFKEMLKQRRMVLSGLLAKVREQGECVWDGLESG